MCAFIGKSIFPQKMEASSSMLKKVFGIQILALQNFNTGNNPFEKGREMEIIFFMYVFAMWWKVGHYNQAIK